MLSARSSGRSSSCTSARSAWACSSEGLISISTQRLPRSISPNCSSSIVSFPAPRSSLPVRSRSNQSLASVLSPCSAIAPSVRRLSAVSEAHVLPSFIAIRSPARAAGRRSAVLSSGWLISGIEASSVRSVCCSLDASARSTSRISSPKPSMIFCAGLPLVSRMFAVRSGIRRRNRSS